MKTAHRDWRLAVKREGTLGCTHNDREGCLWMGFDPQLGDSVYLGIEQDRAEQSRVATGTQLYHLASSHVWVDV